MSIYQGTALNHGSAACHQSRRGKLAHHHVRRNASAFPPGRQSGGGVFILRCNTASVQQSLSSLTCLLPIVWGTLIAEWGGSQMTMLTEDLAAGIVDLHADPVLLAWEIATALADDGQLVEGGAVLQAGLRAAEQDASPHTSTWRAACGAYAMRYQTHR